MKTTLLLLLAPLAYPAFSHAESASQQSSSGLAWQQSERTNTADAYTFSRFTLVGNFLPRYHDDSCQIAPLSSWTAFRPTNLRRGRGTLLAGNLLVGTNLKVRY